VVFLTFLTLVASWSPFVLSPFLSFFPPSLRRGLFLLPVFTMTEKKKRIYTFVKGDSAGASNMKLLVREKRERELKEKEKEIKRHFKPFDADSLPHLCQNPPPKTHSQLGGKGANLCEVRKREDWRLRMRPGSWSDFR